MGGRLARLEGSARILGIAKLANVGLSMLWGFAVTYVFVRALPAQEFRAFLLLVAFNNFTISAELGLTNIVYARLRRYWVARGKGGQAQGEPEQGGFRAEEIGLLFLLLLGLIGLGTAAVGAAMLAGIIRTGLPLLFLLFFVASALNMLMLLARRALAAVECNLLWEAIDLVRRILSLMALLAVLLGLGLVSSVCILLALTLAALVLAAGLLMRRLDMDWRQWFALRVGGGHVRRHYLRDAGASAALTLSEVAGYNAPYFTIAALTHDMRLLLAFDLLFKLSRAVSTTIRATVEAALPRLTRAWYAGDGADFRSGLWRATMIALAIAACAAALLLAMGGRLMHALFDGQASIDAPESAAMGGLMLGLALLCVSVYVQGALGRFGALLRLSLPFLVGSLLVVPAALPAWGMTGQPDVTLRFLLLYALLFVALAALHIGAMRRLRP